MFVRGRERAAEGHTSPILRTDNQELPAKHIPAAQTNFVSATGREIRNGTIARGHTGADREENKRDKKGIRMDYLRVPIAVNPVDEGLDKAVSEEVVSQKHAWGKTHGNRHISETIR